MTVARCLIAAALVAAVPLSPAVADVRAGVTAWQQGNYLAAIAAWRPLAEQGDADAQFNMGQAYKLGRGVAADLKAAQSWFEKAARQDHEEAQANLGLILFQNGERDTAMVWIRKAAERGDPRARYVLATALFNGDGEAKDWPRAYALMSRAAAQGLSAANSSLAEMENLLPESDRQAGMKLGREMAKLDDERAGHQSANSAPSSPPVKTAGNAAKSTQQKPPPAAPTAAAAPKAAEPKPALAKPASAAVATGGGWRVQFGAYGSPDLARTQWDSLSGKLSALRGLKPSYEPVGALTRLRVNALANRAAADQLCTAAKSVGQACFAIAP